MSGGGFLLRVWTQLRLMLKLGAEFIFCQGPGARPEYSDSGRSGRCASELFEDGWAQPPVARVRSPRIRADM